jgi:hypothetical protein
MDALGECWLGLHDPRSSNSQHYTSQGATTHQACKVLVHLGL